MNSSRPKAYFYLILVAAIWGAASPVIKYTIPDFPPFIFLTYRFFITCLILLPIALINKISLPKNSKDLVILFIVSLLGSSINLGLLFYGYVYTTALNASLISAMSPLFVVAAGAIFLKEKVTRIEKVGLLIAFVGTLIITFQPIAENNLFVGKNILGNLLIIAANFAWVAYVILSKYELKHKINPLQITTYMFFVGFITLLPFATNQSGGFHMLIKNTINAPLKAHLGVWYMAILSGALAYYLYQKGQKNIEASEATLFSYLSPLFAAPLAIFWLGETITIPYIIGAIIIAAGVFIAEYKKSQKAKLPSLAKRSGAGKTQNQS